MKGWLRLWSVCLLACLALPAYGQKTVQYFHADALGSVVAVTGANGALIERREYEPYGAQLTPAVQDGPGYTGHVQDAETGLVYMQQRYYDSAIGRFLSVDPVTADSNAGDNFNRYWYANNNPYRFFDPDGRAPQDNWYGLNDQRFRDWVHAEKQLEGRRGAQNYTKAELGRLHEEWKSLGKPRGKGGASGRGGRQRGFALPGFLLKINTAIYLLTYSPELNAGEQEIIDRRMQEAEAAQESSSAAFGSNENVSSGGSGAIPSAEGGGVRVGTYNAQTGEAKLRVGPETGSRIGRTETVCVDKKRCG